MSKSFLVLLLSFIVLTGPISTDSHAQSRKLTYPATEKIDHTDRYGDVAVPDPYHWLEDMKGQKTTSWIKAQDDFLQRFLSKQPARDAIRKRIAELVPYDIYSLPSKVQGKYFYTKTDGVTNRAVLYRQDSLNGEPRVLIDATTRFNDAEVVLGTSVPSPDGRWVLYATSRGQSRWLDYRILDVTNGTDRNDVITGGHVLGGPVSWTQDGKGFFYTRFEKPAGNEQQAVVANGKIYYHRLDEPGDSVIFAPKEETNALLSHLVTDDGRYLIVTLSDGRANNRIFFKDLLEVNGAMKTLIDVANAKYTFLGNKGSRFWFYTDLSAPRGRIVAIDALKPEQDHWQEVIRESDESIAANSSVGGNAVGMIGSRLVLMYLKDGKPLIRVFTLAGQLERTVSLPEGGFVWGGFAGTDNDPEVFYVFTGLRHPCTVFRLNLKNGKQTIFREAKPKFDRSEIVIKRVFYTSKDGTRVPMDIAHKQGLKLDGQSPAYMYGYGAFSWVSFMWYQPQVIAWLDMGGVYALPGIRGGGEYGEEWHQAGMKLKEQNSVDDYIAAAEWLISQRYTTAERLVANGGSASAPLAAVATIQRPELFGASVIDRPILDMLRFDQFTGGAYWSSEFGSPSNSAEFEFLRGYSPYHNLRAGKCYPPTLIMVGDRDQTAVPLHAYKFTAAMQAAQGCDHPVLLKMMWGAGHNFGATPEQRIDSFTDELSFIYSSLNLKPVNESSRASTGKTNF